MYLLFESNESEQLTPNDSDPGTDHNSTQSGTDVLIIPPSLWATVITHLESALPNEGCGLLGGPRSGTGSAHVATFYPGTNILASPRRFRMAPEEVISAFRAMREADEELIAIVHSHPETDPRPSAIDHAEANFPATAMIIVSFQSGKPEAAAWRVEGESPAPVRQIRLRFDSGH